ncbi:MerR family transcriptional regulator [Bifidobacterium psychraerophilum]|jgi:DNA-binding transcriptional MerR regulator|uniref:MerR family transcriptional regulator n=1 Tax=Bifidobacterium psychraerophilum TaxID=218140 RepID=A0A087CEG3_9BIFI|nr:MerR family transcriptional regulator [Bifidobacterium psychraerophilum]KFI81663.1 MerR family transcriptional regulator [Bifidobacterium psychraerophilum]MCI1659724.1 MerR family transcriptional regulator [Bifidobacterium psychraerophilum]MCI1804719.1 MerR family transcriptional regulator [Bifidobacterium psychraerophilum]MCI2176855.1 MerR family transcriptional regulator [Bifidobacterium psychraerophilum]MCI2182188.1 MerR family transcriptional regulator [Bifidobacterium psychraerophilum]
MRIGEFARSTGLTARQVRYWSNSHLLPQKRGVSGYREFEERDKRIALRIRDMLAAGLTIKQIQRLSSCLDYESGVCLRERAELKAKAKDIDVQITHLMATRSMIEEVLRNAPVIQAPAHPEASDMQSSVESQYE